LRYCGQIAYHWLTPSFRQSKGDAAVACLGVRSSSKFFHGGRESWRRVMTRCGLAARKDGAAQQRVRLLAERRYRSGSTGSLDGDASDRSGIGAPQHARDIVGRQTFGKRQEAQLTAGPNASQVFSCTRLGTPGALLRAVPLRSPVLNMPAELQSGAAMSE
jgi:hypothetical protein